MASNDLRFENYFTLVLIRPVTQRGRVWIAQHVDSENWQWMDGGLVIEPRMAGPIYNGAVGDGLAVGLVQRIESEV